MLYVVRHGRTAANASGLSWAISTPIWMTSECGRPDC